ncbi:uncharacterized protein LOC141907005 [Tubulanus polymorphus]|uniref:uncharacterized protein LOC141907005 n=1 Tax=Tubulanus polymorphus TaxID=672921 RepID=UPI003DA24783
MSYPPPQTGYPDYPIPAGQPGCPPPTGDLGYPSSGGQPGYPPPPGASPPMEPPPADTPHGTQAPLPQRQQQTVDAPQQKKSKGVSRSFVHNFSQAIVSLGNDVGKCFSRNGRVFVSFCVSFKKRWIYFHHTTAGFIDRY